MDESFWGHVTQCRRCGVPFHAEDDPGEVIEGHAEPIGPGASYQEPPEEEEYIWAPPVRAPYDEDPDPVRPSQSYRVERRYSDDSGCCCAVGCGLLLFLALVFLRGCAAILF